VRLVNCAAPLSPSVRYGLRNVDFVLIGRGAQAAERRPESGREVLRISEPDARVSGLHARIRKVLGRWLLEDLSSKNGTYLEGAAVQCAAMHDGDLVEIGRTFYLFRESVACEPDEPDDLVAADGGIAGLMTLNPRLARDLRALAAVATSAVSIVLHGETGTGKELLARAVHELSGRKGPFVAVNCGAIPDSLVESELFGVRRGAYSDAKEDRLGLIRSAHKGTLFLDEIGDLEMALQPAFLRVLQEQEVVPVGQAQAIPVDVRVITASHKDIEKLVATKQLRADLCARLLGYAVHLPPLRARREDLGVLIGALIRRIAKDPEQLTFQPDAMRSLLRHAWPMNIRELEKRLAAAIALAQGGVVRLAHLGDFGAPAPAARPTTPEEDRQRAELERLLVEHAGNLTAVARAMGKDRVQVRRWLKRHGLDPTMYRA
jgi:transcriptional regulator with PAS, ATPase and Fis domain